MGGLALRITLVMIGVLLLVLPAGILAEDPVHSHGVELAGFPSASEEYVGGVYRHGTSYIYVVSTNLTIKYSDYVLEFETIKLNFSVNNGIVDVSIEYSGVVYNDSDPSVSGKEFSYTVEKRYIIESWEYGCLFYDLNHRLAGSPVYCVGPVVAEEPVYRAVFGWWPPTAPLGHPYCVSSVNPASYGLGGLLRVYEPVNGTIRLNVSSLTGRGHAVVVLQFPEGSSGYLVGPCISLGCILLEVDSNLYGRPVFGLPMDVSGGGRGAFLLGSSGVPPLVVAANVSIHSLLGVEGGSASTIGSEWRWLALDCGGASILMGLEAEYDHHGWLLEAHVRASGSAAVPAFCLLAAPFFDVPGQIVVDGEVVDLALADVIGNYTIFDVYRVSGPSYGALARVPGGPGSRLWPGVAIGALALLVWLLVWRSRR